MTDPNSMTGYDAATVEAMVRTFLAWRLPADFCPDAGISFKADFNKGTAYPMRHKPIGTNLFTYTQAEAMVRHMLAALPIAPPAPLVTADDAELARLREALEDIRTRASEASTMPSYRLGQIMAHIDDRARAALNHEGIAG